ncbi:phosphoglycolate phosphatase [Snodgrassella alvi]|uniref:HAD family hydrolase n=1 Tax=Snodgrassella alvi TaxID=1196083 RepID=UPI000C1F3782|nr:HAD-IA family hydrolase [Snodgrassella alvi]PIT12829.1 phosphoglycolate phosphatase [Snodgrassella alvi]PIT15354.1 phosphoglycolate phosphatase [Snodgrassella alvi]PIT54566.1 phosphoglycolate phosphatase [Snodgrassella alvi]
MIKAVLFDLDGTLADTAPDLGAALNRVLEKQHLPPKSMAEIRPVASHGAAGLIKLGTGMQADNPEFAALRQAFLAEYELHFTEQTVLFGGIDEVLQKLAQQGIAWGIITNKPHVFTDRLVPKLGCSIAPAVVVSGDTTSAPKPSTEPMLYACQQIGVAPENCLYIGDAERDMQAGRNAGMITVLANWGYIGAEDNTASWPTDYIIEQPKEILELLKK